MQFQRIAGLGAAFFRVGPQPVFRILRSGSILSVIHGGKTSSFSRTKFCGQSPPAGPRHLLRRELTVFGFSFNVALNSS